MPTSVLPVSVSYQKYTEKLKPWLVDFFYVYWSKQSWSDEKLEHIPLEQPVVELEKQIALLRHMAATQAVDLSADIEKLKRRAHNLRLKIFSKLSAYDTTQLSRHPQRPNTLEIIGKISSSFIELHGDRSFYDDRSIVGGLAKIGVFPLLVIGHQKGRDTNDNISRNFGMPKPEGYRKALRLMHLAEKFSLPIISLIDTPGAYPGVEAEERGQSEAIGRAIMEMSKLCVPTIAIVIGEGGSGGALAIGVANRLHMLKHSIYSVISPEGCASILLKDAGQAAQAAEALKLTASHALQLGLIDTIIDEPLGGAHVNPQQVFSEIKKTIVKDLHALLCLAPDKIRAARQDKLASIEFFTE